jgi:hypothetical protein
MSDDPSPLPRASGKPPANDNPRPGSVPFLPTRNAPLVGEGPVASVVRFVWNLVLSVVMATMVVSFLYLFASDAALTMGWLTPAVGATLKTVAWIAGLCIAAVLFLSYYLDETRN